LPRDVTWLMAPENSMRSGRTIERSHSRKFKIQDLNLASRGTDSEQDLRRGGCHHGRHHTGSLGRTKLHARRRPRLHPTGRQRAARCAGRLLLKDAGDARTLKIARSFRRVKKNGLRLLNLKPLHSNWRGLILFFGVSVFWDTNFDSMFCQCRPVSDVALQQSSRIDSRGRNNSRSAPHPPGCASRPILLDQSGHGRG